MAARNQDGGQGRPQGRRGGIVHVRSAPPGYAASKSGTETYKCTANKSAVLSGSPKLLSSLVQRPIGSCASGAG